MLNSFEGNAHCGNYTIIKTLGEGATSKVKLAKDPKGTLVAIKRFKQGVMDNQQIKNQLQIMKKLNHPNLVNLIQYMERAEYVDQEGNKYQANCAVLELVSEGELFDYVASQRFDEMTARTYFKELMEGLKYMHEKGICHRDVKAENLLLNNQFTLKLADFGFSTYIQGPNQDGILKDFCGTEGYMAHQIYLKNYHGHQVDIFAAGIVLFCMYSGHPPFMRALATDPFFKTIASKSFNIFWASHSKKKPQGFQYNASFKSLIQGILAADPKQRFTMKQIFEHPWMMNQPTLPLAERLEQFNKRKHVVIEEKRRKKQQLEKKRSDRNDLLTSKNKNKLDKAGLTRASDEALQSYKQVYSELQEKNIELPIKLKLDRRDFVLKQKQTDILTTILLLLKNQPFEAQFSGQQLQFKAHYDIQQNKFNVQFDFDYEGIQDMIQVQIQFNRTPKGNVCMSFKRIDGNDLYYKCIVNRIKDQFAYCQVEEER